MRRALSLLLILVPLATLPAIAKKPAKVEGEIADATGEAVADVQIVVTTPSAPDFRLEGKSNAEGKFSVTLEDASLDYIWSFSKEGYEPFITNVEIEGGKLAKVTVTLPKDTGGVALRRKATEAYNEGVAAYNEGDREKALEHFLLAAGTDPTLAQAHLGVAETALALGQHEKAAAAARALKDTEEGAQEAPRLLLQAALGMDDDALVAEAVQALGGTEMAKAAAVTLYNRGVGHLNDGGDLTKASTRFHQSSVLDPELAEPRAALATMAFNRQDHAAVLEETAAVLALVPDHTEALRLRQSSAEALGEKEIAAEALAALQDAAPEVVAQQRTDQAEALFKANRVDEAKAILEEVLEAEPENAKAHHFYGLCLLNGGDTAGARKHLQKVVELAPDSQHGRDAKEMLQYVN